MTRQGDIEGERVRGPWAQGEMKRPDRESLDPSDETVLRLARDALFDMPAAPEAAVEALIERILERNNDANR